MSKVYSQNALPVGAMVQEYRIIEILGVGNFGIVYRAENKYFSEIVALKEFLPSDLARRPEGESGVYPLSSETDKAYQWARHKFLQEAKTLRELGVPDQHPNIVRVIQFIEVNDTAYMVMDFEQGQPLSVILEERGPLAEKELRGILDALMDGLERVHSASVWHRDIKPSNILIRHDGSPVLIDFGAARKDITGTDRSTMAVFSPAFAAPEQIYPVGDQGPWTDIYALGATLYRAVTGKFPTNAAERMQKHPHVPAAEAAQGQYSPAFMAAIDAAMHLDPKKRPQSISEWQKQFVTQSGGHTGAEDDRTVIRPVPKQNFQLKVLDYLQALDYRAYVAIIAAVAVLATGLLIYRVTQDPHVTGQTHPIVIDDKKGTDKQNNGLSAEDSGKQDTGDDVAAAPIIRASLMINSKPVNAQVYLNGELKGTTPMDATVNTGAHSLRLTLDAHHDWESTILVEEAGAIPIQIPMLAK